MKSEAQKRACAKYKAKTYDKIELRLHKGERDLVKAKAASELKSVNEYLVELLQREIPEIKGKG